MNSFTSLSLEPPLVLVCLGHFLRSHDALVGSRGYAVTVLRHGREEISRRFATSGRHAAEYIAVIARCHACSTLRRHAGFEHGTESRLTGAGTLWN